MQAESRKRILAAFPDLVREMEPLAPRASFRVGGPATLFGMPTSEETLHQMATLAANEKIPLLVMGDGTNLVIRDGGFDGLVMKLAGDLCRLSSHGNRISAGCGAKLPRLVTYAAKQGLAGLEGLAGIPGTVGGAIAMNAGTPAGSTCERLTRLVWWDSESGVMSGGPEAFRYGYRHFEWQEKGSCRILLGAEWELEKTSPEILLDDLKERLSRRKATQPKGAFNAGCIFKNPAGDSAGRLIDAAGLKGERIGDAQVSPLHANFILNMGSATASEILDLMNRVEERVQTHAGVRLEAEVRIVGKNG